MKDQNSSNKSEADNRLTPIEWMRWVPAALLAIVFLAFVMVSARIVLVPMLISVALAYLLIPVVRWFERRGWSRSSSVLMALTMVSLTVVLVLIFVIPAVWNQLNQSYDQANALVNDQARVDALTLKVKEINPQLYELVKQQIEKYKGSGDRSKIIGWIVGWLQSGLFKLVDLTASILDYLLIPFFIYYLLADYREMRGRIDRLIPPRFRTITSDLMGQINEV
ncbi:MAG: AI-2E family transporter, partial [Blastocatellia bacterium]